MGLFLSASGVIGAGQDMVERSISSFASGRDGTFEPRAGTTNDPNIAVIAESGINTTILYPREFMAYEDLSRHLSSDLQVPVFWFHIHDGDLWMFVLFDKGEQVTQFNPIPAYWQEVTPEEHRRWSGDAQVVCQHVSGVSADRINRYFVEWTEEVTGGGERAYPEDRFPYGVDWQMTDFMRRVGLQYPVRDDGSTDGRTFRLRVRLRRGEG
jgi:hypothetical protein